MANLLPGEYRRSIKTEYRLRLLVVALFLLSGTCIAGSLLLFPSYLTTSVGMREAQAELSVLAAQENEELPQDMRVALENTVKKLELVTSIEETMSIEGMITEVTEARPNGIGITRFAYEEIEDRPALTLSGIARTREALTRFQDNLETLPRFAKVELPVSNLAQAENISFNLTLEFSTED